MPPVSVTIFASDPGIYFLEDDGIPGNNFSRIRFPNGTVVSFEHPTDDLFFAPSVAGITLILDLTDSLGTSRFSTGSFTDPLATPDSIILRNLVTAAGVTLIANGSITEDGSDVAPDIVAASLILSATTGVGTAGNAIETQVGTIEAETTTGGINIQNFGTVSIGGLTANVDGLDVLTSGNLTFTNFGAIVLSDDSGPETIHGGTTSGNVTLIANGIDSDIISNIDQDSISAPRGNIVLTAGRDIGFGLIGANFDNDVRANGSITVNPGRDFLMDGFADMVSDDFGQSTGGGITVNAGRNIILLSVAGTDAGLTASGSAGADLLLNTGPGGSVTLNSGNGTAPFASLISNSGDVIVRADRVAIGPSGAISTPNGIVTMAPITNGWAVNLGSATDVAFALELSDAELDRIFTPNLTLGSNESGPVAVSAAISPLNALNLIVRSGTNINVNASMTVGGSLSLQALDNIFQVPASTITADDLAVLVDSVDDDAGVGGIATLNGALTVTSNIISGNLDNDTLNGSNSANSLRGLAGNDTLRGFGGDDNLAGGSGADVLDGGLGVDTADYVGNFGGVSVNLLTGVGQFNFAHGDTFTDIENVNGTEFGDILTGSTAVNLFNGNGGDDTLMGGAGADVLNGAAGTDTADYRGNFGGVSVNLTTGVGQFNFAHGDTLSGIENVQGTEFGDILTGSAGVNVLNGNGGNDSISGEGGADNLNGGAGVDTLTYAGNFGGVQIDLQAGTGLFNFAQGDVLAGFENVTGTSFGDILLGTTGDNRLEGGDGADQLTGRAGIDVLIGGNADDVLAGGTGADSLDGGIGFDTADYAGEFGAVSINLATGTGQFNSAQGDTLAGIEKVIGTSFGDIFEGNGLDNVFTGGAGNDTFRFAAGFADDLITDFVGNGAAAGDTVRFAAGLFTDFADMIASSAQVGSDVVITLDASNTLTLQNTTLASLDSSDFFYTL